MEAIVNNYLAEPDNADIAKEFSDMQSWRKNAKVLAKQYLAEFGQ